MTDFHGEEFTIETCVMVVVTLLYGRGTGSTGGGDKKKNTLGLTFVFNYKVKSNLINILILKCLD